MAVTVQIPSPLRKLVNNQTQVEIDAFNMRDLVEGLEEVYAGVKEKIVDEHEEIRRYVNIYLNDEDIRFMRGIATTLNEGDVVSIVPAIAGGRYV